MGRLRRKVDRPDEPALIHNVRGEGFIIPCACLNSAGPPHFAGRWSYPADSRFARFLMFGFVYWQTTAEMVGQIDAATTRAVDVIEASAPESRVAAINERLRQDLRRIWLVGLYRPDGARVAGNLESIPRGLQTGAGPQTNLVIRLDTAGRERQTIRAVARLMANGDILVVGRSIDELTAISGILAKS